MYKTKTSLIPNIKKVFLFSGIFALFIFPIINVIDSLSQNSIHSELIGQTTSAINAFCIVILTISILTLLIEYRKAFVALLCLLYSMGNAFYFKFLTLFDNRSLYRYGSVGSAMNLAFGSFFAILIFGFIALGFFMIRNKRFDESEKEKYEKIAKIIKIIFCFCFVIFVPLLALCKYYYYKEYIAVGELANIVSQTEYISRFSVYTFWSIIVYLIF